MADKCQTDMQTDTQTEAQREREEEWEIERERGGKVNQRHHRCFYRCALCLIDAWRTKSRLRAIEIFAA